VIKLTDYVIDENVILDAWRGKRFKEYAGYEKLFLTSFFLSTHRFAFDEEIKRKIMRMRKYTFDNPEFLDSSVVPMMTKIIHDSTRAQQFQGINTNFKGVKKCDKHFVGVALQTNAILVTNDEKLHDAINDDESVSHCRHLNPKDAIDTIKQEN